MIVQKTMPVPREVTMPAPRAHFCTGFGQYDTHSITLSSGKPNTAACAGSPYTGVTEADILAMVGNPPSVAKTKAQWFIPSDYRAHDGRDHEAQRQHGQFWAMTLDLDENNLAMADIQAALISVAGDAGRLIYSSRSAKPDNLKWRALCWLETPIAGADYADTVEAFYDLLEEASVGVLIPDRGLARPGQIVYLPNRGEHYEHDIHKGARLHLTPDHPIIQRREETRHKRAAAEAKVAEWKAWKARQAPTDTSSIVGAFNSAETMPICWQNMVTGKRGAATIGAARCSQVAAMPRGIMAITGLACQDQTGRRASDGTAKPADVTGMRSICSCILNTVATSRLRSKPMR